MWPFHVTNKKHVLCTYLEACLHYLHYFCLKKPGAVLIPTPTLIKGDQSRKTHFRRSKAIVFRKDNDSLLNTA